MKKLTLLIFIFVSFSVKAQNQLTSRQERNLISFAKVYGYVQFFHPSDEAQQVHWAPLAVKGCLDMLSIKNDEDLIARLNFYFKTIAPTIQIFKKNTKPLPMVDMVPPDNKSAKYKTISWQHKGLYIDDQSSGFASIRLNRPPVNTEAPNIIPFFNNIDVSGYAGLAYQLELGLTATGEEKNCDFDLEGADDNHNHASNWRYNRQTLTDKSQNYVLKGLIGDSAKALSLNLLIPQRFPVKINSHFAVTKNGREILLDINKQKVVDQSQLQNIRIQLSSTNAAFPLYPERLHLGDKMTKEIVPGIECIMPLAVLGDAAHTYPIGGYDDLKNLQAALAFGNKYHVKDLIKFPEIRLANIIMTWNFIRHSFAYWEDSSLPPGLLLTKSLNDAYLHNTTLGFFNVLQRMGAALNDGHVFVVAPFKEPDSLSLPIWFTKAESKIIAFRLLDSSLMGKISPGDVILKLDKQNIQNVLKNKESMISGSPQNKEHRGLVQMANGPRRTAVLRFIHRGKIVNLNMIRSVKALGYHAGYELVKQIPNGWIKPGIYYLNLARDNFNPDLYPILAQAKSIIFDVRGYPPGDDDIQLISMLLTKKQKVTRFYGLKVLKPDLDDLIFDSETDHYAPAVDKHLSAKAFFLTDASAQSAAESFLGLIKDLKLGILIGSPTSGANGNINSLQMLGNYTFTFSGILVKNSDGSIQHEVGVVPDFNVKPSIESIRMRRDLVLEKAINMASNQRYYVE
jgi:hypothetical protein